MLRLLPSAVMAAVLTVAHPFPVSAHTSPLNIGLRSPVVADDVCDD
jgi:hypothetical protein